MVIVLVIGDEESTRFSFGRSLAAESHHKISAEVTGELRQEWMKQKLN